MLDQEVAQLAQVAQVFGTDRLINLPSGMNFDPKLRDGSVGAVGGLSFIFFLEPKRLPYLSQARS